MSCRIIKQYRVGDTRPSLLVQLWSDRDNAPVDIIGKSVVFFLENRFTQQVVIDSAVVVVSDADQAIVRYDFEDGDLDVSGQYAAYFVVDNNGTEQQTFPGIRHGIIIEVQ